MTNEPRRPGRHFLQFPGPTPVPERVLNAMSRQMLDHRGPEFRSSAKGASRREDAFQDSRTPSSSIHRPARARGKPASSIRCRPATSPDRRDGPVRRAVGNMAEKLGLKPEVIADRLAHRRRRQRRSRRRLQEGQGARHQGRVHRAQRDLDRLPHLGSMRSARRWMRRKHPALFMVDTVSCSRRGLPPRRVGRRRRRLGLAEGHDAAAGAVVHGRQPEGARRLEDREADALLLVVGRHAGHERGRLLPLHAGDRPAVWPRRGDRHAATRKASTTSSRATSASPRRRAARCALGSRDLVPRSRSPIRRR